MTVNLRWPLFVGVLLMPGWSGAAPPCPQSDVLYIPVETVKERFGLNGETRAQFLNRQYGADRWQPDTQGIVTVEPASESIGADLHVVFQPAPGHAVERVDVVVETRLDHVDKSGRESLIYGYRELASYAIVSGTSAQVDVPAKAFPEPGALLVAVLMARVDPPGEPVVVVHGHLVSAGSCERHVYTADRFTAIRLNRKR